MQWITIILLGFAANLDNLGIGLAYGVKNTKIPFTSNLTIAVISMVVTFTAVLAGGTISEYISPITANVMGSLLLCCIGVWTLFSQTSRSSKSIQNPALIDTDGDQIVSMIEALTLGIILSANCLAVGIGMGANGLSTSWSVLSIGLFSFLTIGLSSYFGSLLSEHL